MRIHKGLYAIAFIIFLIGFVGGSISASVIGIAQSPDGEIHEEQPTVTCTTFLSNGTANGICFTSGDVKFRWLNEQNNTKSGNISLDGLPVDNSTVRRENDIHQSDGSSRE